MNRIPNFWVENKVNKCNRHECCGCTACESVCGKEAISIHPDAEGFMYPVIDEKKCVDCGMCLKVCPVANKCENEKPYFNSYAGYSTDRKVIESCATGGIATALSIDTIRKGGVVFGVQYNENCHEAAFSMAKSEKELWKFSNSKYVQPKKEGIYKKVKEQLITGMPVLFVGCPCDIAALKRLLKKEYENLLTCELFCAGITSDKVLKDYIEYREKKMRSKLLSLNVRSKERGWFVQNIKEVYDNKKIYFKNHFGTYLGYAFLTFRRPSCYYCQYKQNVTYCDIKCGDFWGIKDSDPFWNPLGVSVILAKTQKGIDVLENLKNFKLYPVNHKRATVNNAGFSGLPGDTLLKRRNVFEDVYITNVKGLIAACKATAPKSFWIKYYVPTKYHVFLKKIFHMIVDRK